MRVEARSGMPWASPEHCSGLLTSPRCCLLFTDDDHNDNHDDHRAPHAAACAQRDARHGTSRGGLAQAGHARAGRTPQGPLLSFLHRELALHPAPSSSLYGAGRVDTTRWRRRPIQSCAPSSFHSCHTRLHRDKLHARRQDTYARKKPSDKRWNSVDLVVFN